MMGSYIERIWLCLEYHWRRFAATDAVPYTVVVHRIENGNLAYGNVESNVLWEVALAHALGLRENTAAEIFEEDYMPKVRSIARRIGGEAVLDFVENLAAELILPRQDSPARIETYRGRTPLGSWLRSLVANAWISHTRKKQPLASNNLPEAGAIDDPAQVLDERQCEALLRPAFSEAVEMLEAEDRLLLKILILDGAPQNQVANSLGISSGTLTRKRQRAATRVLSSIRQIGAKGDRSRQVSECLQLLLAGNESPLRQRLAEVLARDIVGSDALLRSEDDDS